MTKQLKSESYGADEFDGFIKQGGGAMTRPLEALIARILKLAALAEQTNINESSESWVAYLNEVSPANVRELIAALGQAQQDSDTLSQFNDLVAQASMALKGGKPLGLEQLFQGRLASSMFAVMFAGEFVRHGAENYLELLYDVQGFGEFTVTVQKKEGKTPCERIAELEAEQLERINVVFLQAKHIETLESMATKAIPLAVKLPERLSPEGYHIGEAYLVQDPEGDYLDRDEVIEAIRAAGGTVSEGE